MKRPTKLYLWLSLISSIIILFESVTGLIAAEPQWFGGQAPPQFIRQNFNRGNFPSFNQGNGQGNSNYSHANGSTSSNGKNSIGSGSNGSGSSAANGTFSNSNTHNFRGGYGGYRSGNGNFSFANRNQNSLSSFIQQLHRGYIKNVNLHWVTDLFAIFLILFSLYGIYMSTQLLRSSGSGTGITKE